VKKEATPECPVMASERNDLEPECEELHFMRRH